MRIDGGVGVCTPTYVKGDSAYSPTAATTVATTTFLRALPRFFFAVDVSGAATHVAVVSHQTE